MDGLHHIVAEFAAGAARIAARDGQLLLLQHADIERALKQVGLFLTADVGEKHDGCAQHGAGVCILAASLTDHAGCGAVDGLEHCIAFADICAARRADAALEFCGLVRDDIAIQVRQDEDAEIAAALLIDELCREDIDIPFVRGDFRVFLADLLSDVEEFAIRRLDDVGLRDNGDAVLAVTLCVIVGQAGDALAALRRRHDEIHRKVVRHMHAFGTDGVGALRVLAEEGPVDALIRHLDRPHVGKQVERLAHRHVCALDIRPRVAGLRGRGWALEDDVALFELVVRDGLIGGHAVFDRQAVDHFKFDLAGLDVVRKHVFEHTGGFLRDDRADAVAAAHADDDFVELLIVDKILICLDAVGALILLTNKRLKMCHGGFDLCFVHWFILHL